MQGLPLTRFNSSTLVRVLADLVDADAPESKQSFAERLGQWLGFADALLLFSTLNADEADAVGPPPAVPSPATEAPRREFARVRAALADSIGMDGERKPGKADLELPTPAPQASLEGAADFAPYHRYYLAHQRDMNARIGHLRASVRAVLSGHTADLKRLAALDAVLDRALAARERSVLATVPVLLGRRFAHLFGAHQTARSDAPTADDAQQWMLPGGWLAVFCAEMQAVLLAELDLRLQPTAGLIAALDDASRAGADP